MFTKRFRLGALVAGVVVVLSACGGDAGSQPDTPAGSGSASSSESASIPVDKPVVEGFFTGDIRLSPPPGAQWLTGEEGGQWDNNDQLGLMVFDDHYAGSENFPTVELRYFPQHFTPSAAVREISMILTEGELGEPVEHEGHTFERFVGSGEFAVGSEYMDVPGEAFFTRRNEGTYFLYILGIPGESDISDELRQTAFDALEFDTAEIDEYFPPGQDDGAVTLELDSFAEFVVGRNIPAGRYEVFGDFPADVSRGHLVVHQEGGSVYEAYRPIIFAAGDNQEGTQWAGFIELVEGDVVSYALGGLTDVPTYGSVTFKPLPEPTAYRTVLPGNGVWISGVDFEPGAYQFRASPSGQVGIFDPDGNVLFDGRIAETSIEDFSELRELEDRMAAGDVEAGDYTERELTVRSALGMVPVSTAFDLPAGSRVVTWPNQMGESTAVSLIPAPRATQVPTSDFTADAGQAVDVAPDQQLWVAGQDIEPGMYSLTYSAGGGSSDSGYLQSLSGAYLHSFFVDDGASSAPFYVPSNSTLLTTAQYLDPGSITIEPAEPVPFEGGEYEERMLRVGTDIEPGTWSVHGLDAVLDVLDAQGRVVHRLPVWNDSVQRTLELEDGHLLVPSTHNVLGEATLEPNSAGAGQ